LTAYPSRGDVGELQKLRGAYRRQCESLRVLRHPGRGAAGREAGAAGRAIIADGSGPEMERRFSYAMDDYGPCKGLPICDEVLFRALGHVEKSDSNFFALTENATGRFLQTPGHCYIEASPAKGKVYGRKFGSLDEFVKVFLGFLFIGQFPDISSWESVSF